MNTEYKYIQINHHNQYINILFDRPEKRNALNNEMITEIQSALNLYKKNTDIKVVLISSSSDVFCAGADLQHLQNIKEYSYEENLKDSEILKNLYKTMLLYPKLIISKVCGPAIAGGCGIMTASDVIFSTSTSKFGYPEVKIGFIPALVSVFLVQKIKETHARELLLTGKLIDAQTAKEIGLIHHICEANEIDDNVNSFIHNMINKTSSNSISETKKMLFSWFNFDKNLNKAAEWNAQNRKSADFQKGISHFLNKEKINWK